MPTSWELSSTKLRFVSLLLDSDEYANQRLHGLLLFTNTHKQGHWKSLPRQKVSKSSWSVPSCYLMVCVEIGLGVWFFLFSYICELLRWHMGLESPSMLLWIARFACLICLKPWQPDSLAETTWVFEVNSLFYGPTTKLKTFYLTPLKPSLSPKCFWLIAWINLHMSISPDFQKLWNV